MERLRQEDITSTELRLVTDKWLKKYESIYTKKQVTPYMHVFRTHLHEQTRIHGHINLYNLQGLEKQNDITTVVYFRQTNKKNKPVRQILLKFLRMEALENILSIVSLSSAPLCLIWIFDDEFPFCYRRNPLSLSVERKMWTNQRRRRRTNTTN